MYFIQQDHLQHVFGANCSVYRVLGDVVFATDVLGGPKDKDVMLVNLNKFASADCPRRPMRSILKLPADYTKSEESTKHHRQRPMKQGNVNKEQVSDAITRIDFGNALRLLIPEIPEDEVDYIFNDACQLSFEIVTRALDTIWTRCWDEKLKRHFYVNKITNTAQWTRPFHQKNFHTREIEESVFLKTLLKFDILTRR
jgi:hypothetical protein